MCIRDEQKRIIVYNSYSANAGLAIETALAKWA